MPVCHTSGRFEGFLPYLACLQVARFLNSTHGDKYRVFNVSERQYDPAWFEYRVLDAGFPDHYAPPLDLAWYVSWVIDVLLER